MATAGPTGTRSGTVSTHSGTVDMSIHNESNRSGAGSQAEAAVPAAGGSHAGGWAGDEYEDDGDSQVGLANCRGVNLSYYVMLQGPSWFGKGNEILPAPCAPALLHVPTV
jgi:hypothetical protein